MFQLSVPWWLAMILLGDITRRRGQIQESELRNDGALTFCFV
nr:hypothetical protein [Mycoplasmopsis bovis]